MTWLGYIRVIMVIRAAAGVGIGEDLILAAAVSEEKTSK